MVEANKLPVDTDATADAMAQTLFGDGIEIVNASYTGADSASGIYTDGDTVSSTLTPSDTGVILSTGNAMAVTNDSGDANKAAWTSTSHGTAGDSDLNEIAGSQTYDAAVFEATFVPEGSTLTMQVVFGSEEYLEYVNSGFNDAMVVMVNGEKATLTVGEGDITINSINDVSNSNLYIDNAASDDAVNTEMDGITVSLTLKAPVIPGQENTIKIAIADGGDSSYDSNLLIAGGSIQTALIAGDDEITMGTDDTKSVDLLDNDASSASSELTIVAINGTPVVAGSTVMLSTGEEITLNGDGTISIESDGDIDSNVFSYTVQDGAGNTDTGFATINTVPCFVAGTRIRTPIGDVPVECLSPGDLVSTLDHGFQAVRWVGKTTRIASGRDAPVLFKSGAIGNAAPLEVSPNHRLFVGGARAEIMFGECELLAHAKHLVNGRTVLRRQDGAPVTYVHLLFDRHEVVWSQDVRSESYHPGDMTLDSFCGDTRDEIMRLMPGILDQDATSMPTARRCLRGYEAATLPAFLG